MAHRGHTELESSQIVALLAPFGIVPTIGQTFKIAEYIRILLKWNKLFSLTSITDPREIVSRHFGESLYLSELLPVENCRLADVGTGGGFPGLPLKMMNPGTKVTLIESSKKKCAFLSEVVASLGLKEVEIVNSRFEEIRPESFPADLVVARALGAFPELLRWAARSLTERGHIALWVGGEDAARIASGAGWTWVPATQLPESQRRYILLGRPIP